LNNTKTTNNNRFTTYFQLAKLRFYHQHDIEGALAYLEKIGNRFGEDNSALLTLRADILAQQQQPATAYEYYMKALRNTSDVYVQCTSYEGLASMAPLLNKPDSTRYFIDQYKSLLDSIYTMNKQREITEIKDKHIVEIHDQQMRARHVRFMFWMGILAVALLLGTAITFLLIDRKRKKRYLQAQEELRQANVEVLRAQVDEQPADLDALYRKKLAACQNLFRRTPSARLLLVPPASLTAAQRQTLMDDLTRSFVDVMLDVKNASNAVNDQELMYCILSSLQCSTAQMAELLNNTDGTLRKRKIRLKEKMPENLYSLFFS
jgi:tetratricopeptide (TPR) repeat protein